MKEKKGENEKEREREVKWEPPDHTLVSAQALQGDFLSFNVLPPLILTLLLLFLFFLLQIKIWHVFEVLTASKTCSH